MTTTSMITPSTPTAPEARTEPTDPTAEPAPRSGPDSLRFLDRPGGRLAYDVAGSGPLVVMLPGLGDLRRQFRLLAPAVASAGFQAVTADLRGHGDSSVSWPDYGSEAAGADLVALIEANGGGPAVVVGNSFGAAPAVWAAAERPDLVAGLVLIGPFVRAQRTPWWKQALLRALMTGPWRVAAWGTFYASLYPSRRPDDFDAYRRSLLASLRERGRFDAVRAMAFRDDRAIEARLPRVTAATLVVMGSQDPDFEDPAAEARAIAEATAGQVALIDGAGHYPHVEMPEETTPAVLDFLRDVHRG